MKVAAIFLYRRELKKLIRDFEQEVGISEATEVCLHLAGALTVLDRKWHGLHPKVVEQFQEVLALTDRKARRIGAEPE